MTEQENYMAQALALAREAAAVLSQNKAERHIRGGAATREKYRACGTVKK